MWDPTNDDSVECVSLEIENLTELLDLMLSSSEHMGNKQITALLGLCLNLSSGIFLWVKEEEKRREKEEESRRENKSD
ncbi:hypothetical protein [Raoultella terrigena]|uniref:hypothetical protein n=1 Tax=Raoultella terrigena TaxID=577 RepID=UPI0009762D2B|nr:hypothetical protein [Raoultella terrigena]OMP89765.1 hypothetical protein BZP36_26345 [Raoultella terrigena]